MNTQLQFTFLTEGSPQNVPISPTLAFLELFHSWTRCKVFKAHILYHVPHPALQESRVLSVIFGYMHERMCSRFPHRSQHTSSPSLPTLSGSSLYLKCLTLTTPPPHPWCSPSLFHLPFKDKFKSFVTEYLLSIPPCMELSNPHVL